MSLFTNCKHSRALIFMAIFLLLISGETHYNLCDAPTNDSRQWYRKKHIDVSFKCVCPVIDNEFRHNIVKVAVDPRGDS